MAATEEAAVPVKEEEEVKAGDGEASKLEEEEPQVEFKPLVELTEVETNTGEEDEEILYKVRAKLLRFDPKESQWKERGVGEVKILKHKENKKIRLLMRREKTYKICLNHYVNYEIELQENISSDRLWVWSAADYADGEKDDCVLAIRFASTEVAQQYKDEYDKARAFMKELVGAPADADDDDDDGDDAGDDDEEEKEAATEEKTEGAAGPKAEYLQR